MLSLGKIYINKKQKIQALNLNIQIHINVDLISVRQVKNLGLG